MKTILYAVPLLLMLLPAGCNHAAVPDGGQVSSEFITGDGDYCIISVSRQGKYHMLVVIKTCVTSNQPGVTLFTDISDVGDKITVYTEDTGKVELKNKYGIYIFDDTNGPAVYFYEKEITPEQYAGFKEKCGNRKDFVLEDLIRFFNISRKPVLYKQW